jgi:hypothetical protein
MLEAVRDIKVSQRDEAKDNLDALNASKNVVDYRKEYYNTRSYTNSNEDEYLSLSTKASYFSQLASDSELAASILHLLPNLKFGSPFTAGTESGGWGLASEAIARASGATVTALNIFATKANILGSYERRKDDGIFSSILRRKNCNNWINK